MIKIIALPLLLIVLNFNAQKDFITKYDLKTFVSNNYELIENINSKKKKDRIKLYMKLFQHRKKQNNGIMANSKFNKDMRLELKEKMSDNENFIKIRNRARISIVINITALIGVVAILYNNTDPLVGILAAFITLSSAVLVSIIPIITTSKLNAQLLKDYLLSISSADTN